jgi:hypothetical protein
MLKHGLNAEGESQVDKVIQVFAEIFCQAPQGLEDGEAVVIQSGSGSLELERAAPHSLSWYPFWMTLFRAIFGTVKAMRWRDGLPKS